MAEIGVCQPRPIEQACGKDGNTAVAQVECSQVGHVFEIGRQHQRVVGQVKGMQLGQVGQGCSGWGGQVECAAAQCQRVKVGQCTDFAGQCSEGHVADGQSAQSGERCQEARRAAGGQVTLEFQGSDVPKAGIERGQFPINGLVELQQVTVVISRVYGGVVAPGADQFL